ncbi:GNAT family N-acetyltransferase [Marinomonas transparens]|uniref:GNAT family N-acetyltransferase n=1 Tax=Marinomonas transparens TaxID=2795388 RepID=A0A934JKD4_9GAMM|nr:GNAT family N-acetyltransferase [Marinomonas transparens]MBJ7537421.1 GNAT family N-acetyltransferase [Marinomonas transparens]
MKMEFTAIKPDEFAALFTVVKQGIYPYVEECFSWNDDVQRDRLINDYQPHWFHWLMMDRKQIGLVCFKPYDDAFHIHLLILLPDYQKQGFGKKVMQQIHQRAKQESKRKITLSSFSANQGALRFYQSLDYQTTAKDEQFHCLALLL